QRFPAGMGAQARRLQPLGEVGDNVERAGADRAGRAEDDNTAGITGGSGRREIITQEAPRCASVPYSKSATALRPWRTKGAPWPLSRNPSSFFNSATAVTPWRTPSS